jgi:hypothetical protein
MSHYMPLWLSHWVLIEGNNVSKLWKDDHITFINSFVIRHLPFLLYLSLHNLRSNSQLEFVSGKGLVMSDTQTFKYNIEYKTVKNFDHCAKQKQLLENSRN